MRVDAKYSSQPSALSIGSPSGTSLLTDGISLGVSKSTDVLARVTYHRSVEPSPYRPGAAS